MLRVRTLFEGVAGSPWYSNLYFAGSTQAEAQTWASEVHEFWTNVAGAISNQVTVTVDPTVLNMVSTTGVIEGAFVVDDVDPFDAGNAAQMLPLQTQLVVALNTDLYAAGRRVQGRLFIPGLCEDSNDVDGSATLTITDFVNTQMESLYALEGGLVVWSRKNGLAVPVTSAVAKRKWGFLSSRRD